MQTESSAVAEESPFVRLRCGELVSRHQLNRVLSLKHEENGEILLNDLILRSQDDSDGFSTQFLYFDGSLRRLEELGFLDEGWNVPASIRAIALSLID